MEPPAPAEDRAEPKSDIGRVAVLSAAPTLGKNAAPTDPDDRDAASAPQRAAPALPSQLPLATAAGGEEKAPPVVVARLDGAGPASAAPSVLSALQPVVPAAADTLWPLSDTTGAAAQTVPPTPVALPAPTVLPIEETAIAALRTSPPALPEPPQTPPTERARVQAVPEPEAPATEKQRPAAPETEAGETIASLPAEQKAVSVEAPPLEPEAAVALSEPPVTVPETDISTLQTVPEDLLRPPPRSRRRMRSSPLSVVHCRLLSRV